MIKKNDETGENRKISSFKKFSELNTKSNPSKEDPELSVLPEKESNRPANPNLPYNKSKVGKPASTKYLKPIPEEGLDFDDDRSAFEKEQDSDTKNESKVKFYGKIAKLPKGTKASKGFNFLENIKISKSSVWYLLVEKMSNELQMVKYNNTKGVDLSKFVGDLKEYYKGKYSKNEKIVKLVESIEIDGNDKYSCIKNIPLIEIDGQKMISKITEDLIKLLSK